ncbi:MAG: mnmA, partial [Oscillospiraceae bacterium]|nr:mnmA [Oscillospiraceae bacterium]
GNFVLKDGTVLGEHKGIIHYTVGQRKGLGLSFAQPMYVTDKDKQTNTVTLGEKQELFSKALIAQDVNWIWIDTLDGPMKVTTKTRYRQKETPATIFPHEQGVLVEFDEPQRAITPGQAVVFYDEEVVVGGATIMKAL